MSDKMSSMKCHIHVDKSFIELVSNFHVWWNKQGLHSCIHQWLHYIHLSPLPVLLAKLFGEYKQSISNPRWGNVRKFFLFSLALTFSSRSQNISVGMLGMKQGSYYRASTLVYHITAYIPKSHRISMHRLIHWPLSLTVSCSCCNASIVK